MLHKNYSIVWNYMKFWRYTLIKLFLVFNHLNFNLLKNKNFKIKHE